MQLTLGADAELARAQDIARVGWFEFDLDAGVMTIPWEHTKTGRKSQTDYVIQLAPQVIELEDRTVMLSGNVEDQYTQWREILADIYRAEIGDLELPEHSAATAE